MSCMALAFSSARLHDEWVLHGLQYVLKSCQVGMHWRFQATLYLTVCMYVCICSETYVSMLLPSCQHSYVECPFPRYWGLPGAVLYCNLHRLLV